MHSNLSVGALHTPSESERVTVGFWGSKKHHPLTVCFLKFQETLRAGGWELTSSGHNLISGNPRSGESDEPGMSPFRFSGLGSFTSIEDFAAVKQKKRFRFFFLVRYGSETSISGVFKHKNRQGKPGLDPNLQYQVFTLFRDFRCKLYHSTHLSQTSNKHFSTMKQYFFLIPKIKKSVFDEKLKSARKTSNSS